MSAVYLTRMDMAERLGVPVHRVRYLLRVCGIDPAVVVGPWPGYTEKNLERVRVALESGEHSYLPTLSATEKR